MNVREMFLMAKSVIRDPVLLDAHFLRWLNLAYRQLSRDHIIQSLNYGDQIELVAVTGDTQTFYLPYDYSAIIAIVDGNGRIMDPIRSMDVRQFGEYNSFGSFACFYEYSGTNQTPLQSSGATPITIGIANRGTTVTASAAVFSTTTSEGEFLLPLDRNSTAGAGNPEDYAYRIDSVTSTTIVELERPFRGVVSDAGVVGDLTTGYFEVRPKNTKLIRIWGDPGSTATMNLEYQRIPSKLANNEDVPEEPRLAEAIVYKAIDLAGWAYQNGFHAKKAMISVAEAMSQYISVQDRDKELIHNYLTANPNYRSYSQIGGMRTGNTDRYSGHSVNY